VRLGYCTIALLLVALAAVGSARAQQAAPLPVDRPVPEDAEARSVEPPAEEPPPGGEHPADVGGSWAGWAKLTNDWPGLVCQYAPADDQPSVHVELSPATAGGLHGSVAIDLPAPAGTPCPPLRKRYAIAEVRMAPGAASFTDSGGNEWTLSSRRAGSVLEGTLAWQLGGLEEPLAEGFATPNGVRPMARLGGEVHLRRTDVPGPEAAAAVEEKAAPKASAGQHAGNVAKILGANVVGLGLLYGVNELGKGSSSAGVLTCSPRVCIVGAPNQPCFCEGNVVSGASCGATTGGVPIGGACDGTTNPCQATLSCNSNVCEDRDGRCPY
jgi:hypothetical protein